MLKNKGFLICFGVAQCRGFETYHDGVVGFQGGYAGYREFNRVVYSFFCEKEESTLNFFDSKRYTPNHLKKTYVAACSVSVYSSSRCTEHVDFGTFLSFAGGRGSVFSGGLAIRYVFTRCFVRGSLGPAFGVESLKRFFEKDENPAFHMMLGARLAIEFAYYFTKHWYGSTSIIGVIGHGRSLSVGFNMGVTSKACLV